MSGKDKEAKGLKKLKQFFGLNKGGIGSLKSRQDFILTIELEQQLGQKTALNQRGKAIKELCEAVKENSFEHSDMERLRHCLQDLFLPNVPPEYRHLAFTFYCCLVQGQYDRLGLMRVHVFDIIKSHDIPEDVSLQLELLQALTDNGKDIEHMEEEMGHFLLEWMPAVVTAGKTQEYLVLLVNVVKFNAAYIDDDVVMELVQNVCYLCCWSNSKDVVVGCLQVLDTVVCYSNLPPESLQDFVSALCRTVNVETYCPDSWKIMRNLLGTHMGHSALYTMCRILQSRDSQTDIGLMRGAVFYINMGLWGNKRVPSLVCTHTSVLPSLLQATLSGHHVVVYEVMLSCQRLVNKYGLELQDPAWDLVLSVLEAVIQFVDGDPLAKHLHETLCTIEKLIELGQFNGSVRRVFELIERCSHVRPEVSVMRLVTYLASSIVPTRHLWLAKLHSLLDKFFRVETRRNIRIKVLGVLDKVIRINRAAYEDELIEQAVVPFLSHIDQDQDVAVRNAAAELLIELCLKCDSKRCIELLDILEKLLNRPFEVQSSSALLQTFTDAEVSDVCTVASGVVRIFVAKMYQLPSCHAIRAYKLLVNHLDNHYRQPAVLDHHPTIRYTIFECFLRIRANSFYQLGYPGGSAESPEKPLVFSPYLGVDHKHGEHPGGASSPPPVSPAPTPYPPCVFTQLSLTHACKAVISCLKHEKDWKVLHLILQEVPQVMKNKALILSRNANDIDFMASALCSMLSDKTLPEFLRNTPTPKFPHSEVRGYVFPVLASLASYHNHLEPPNQARLILCLELGLQSRFAGQVVAALTTCTLEMKDAMCRLLPEVLLNLSKISATVHIAIPILSFLSTLTRLPKVFASFVGDQYMSVVAISLPYTNPFKYNHFIVSLAHHVIAVWFLKSRLPYRRDLVKFITKGLNANVLVPLEEVHVLRQDPTKMELVNEDSSSRKRSSSLTEQGSRRRPVTGSSRLDARPVDLLKPPVDEASLTFHRELTETCIDLMARYTFSTCSAMPKRLPAAQSLLAGGQSTTWLLGNRLITVTTSGCKQKVLRNGLCDKCLATCRMEPDVLSPVEGTGLDAGSNVSQTVSQSQSQAQNQGQIQAQGRASLQRSSSVDVPAMSVREDSSASSAAASASAGGSSRNLPLLMQVPQTGALGADEQSSGSTGSSSSLAPAAISSPTDEHRKLSGSLELMEPESSKLDQLLFGVEKSDGLERQQCACWCNGWAEIYVRRPTGDMSWVMRIQNQNISQELSDIPTIFLPSLIRDMNSSNQQMQSSHSSNTVIPHRLDTVEIEPSENLQASSDDTLVSQQQPLSSASDPVAIPASPVRRSPSRQGSRDSLDEEEEGDPDAEMDDGSGRARNPVRRSNSSPEMSAGWRNPFLSAGATDRDKLDKMTKPSYSKDLRANCEAIPEEIAGLGTTPPSTSPIVARFPAAETVQKTIPQSTTCTLTSSSEISSVTLDVATSTVNAQSKPNSNTLVSSQASNPASAHHSLQSIPTTMPLMLPLTAKPPLSPTQARHHIPDIVDQKSKIIGTASPGPGSGIITGVGGLTGARVGSGDPARIAMSGRLSSGSASSSVGGSTSSLDSKATTELLQLQLDRSSRLQQTSAPASPTTSHVHHLSASAERINRDDGGLRQDPAALPPLSFKRDRGHTISVMSPVRKPRGDWEAKRNKTSSTSPRSKEQRSSVNPNMVFLQLYHSSYFGNTTEKPVLVSNSAQFQRSIKVLDCVPPYETHKVGVLYVGVGQTMNEQEILRNTTGSLRYTEFLQRLGTLIRLQDADPHLFLGGLETSGKDGKFAYVWQDDVTQLTFHVATLMPTRDSDPSCNDKKRHIGNNFVTIVYNESGEDFSIHTVKGQFSYACVEIQPLDHGSNQVIVRTRDELAELGVACEPKVVSDLNLGILARQLALHANLASHVLQSLKVKGGNNTYASNWLERLRAIKRMRARILQDSSAEESASTSGLAGVIGGNNSAMESGSRISRHLPDDFTDYT